MKYFGLKIKGFYSNLWGIFNVPQFVSSESRFPSLFLRFKWFFLAVGLQEILYKSFFISFIAVLMHRTNC